MLQISSQYVSTKSLLLMVGEASLILLSLVFAVKLRFWNDETGFALYIAFPDFAMQSAIVVAVCVTTFYCNDLYDLSSGSSSVDHVLRVEQSLGAASLLLGLLYFLLPNLLLSRGVFIIGMTVTAVVVVFNRRVLDRAWKLTGPTGRVLILGTGQIALDVARELTRREDLGLKLEGFVSAVPLDSSERIFGFPVLGSAPEIESIAKRTSVSNIIVALEDRRRVLPTRELVTLRVQGVRIDDAPSALAALTGRVSLRSVKPGWFVFSDGFRRSKWNDLLKRILDLVASVVGLLISTPIMVAVGLAIRLDSKGPIIYRQTRVGRMGKCFEALKFRSMQCDAEKESGAQWAKQNDPRVTRIGAFLRKYRLDEIPQFINVIRGDMSFVGPRPERPCFVEMLRESVPYYDERHSVRPGITGWAQVQYCYGASVEDAFNKLEYDFYYLKHMSILFDLAIILKTVRIVLGGHGGR
jgi:sugar transferase (PEP-CTERM system associated)